MTEPPVLVRVDGRVGRLTLNRPQALHALTLEMCALMTEALLAWRDDPAVTAVTLDHVGPRGFCAGGDIRALSAARADGGQAARAFFRTEYGLNALLHAYPKPTVAIMDGVTMGGGVGLALPCSRRVATERTLFAMPETAIGLFPDVGGGWWLPRLPGQVGMWLALTGARLKAADCVSVGLATHVVDSARLDDLKARLIADAESLDAALDTFAAPVQPAPLDAHRADVDRLFAGADVEAIVDALAADDGAWAAAQAHTLSRMSPQALKVSFRLLREGAERASFIDEMAAEYALGSRVVLRPDLAEGVRALLIDKDNAPKWSPGALAEVDDALIDALFAPLPADDAWSPSP